MSTNLNDDYADGDSDYADALLDNLRAEATCYSYDFSDEFKQDVYISLITNPWGRFEWEATIDGEVVDTDEYLDNIVSTLDGILIEKLATLEGSES